MHFFYVEVIKVGGDRDGDKILISNQPHLKSDYFDKVEEARKKQTHVNDDRQYPDLTTPISLTSKFDQLPTTNNTVSFPDVLEYQGAFELLSVDFSLSVIRPVTLAEFSFVQASVKEDELKIIKSGDLVYIYEAGAFGGDLIYRLMWTGRVARGTTSESLSGKIRRCECENLFGQWSGQDYVVDKTPLDEGFANQNFNQLTFGTLIDGCRKFSYLDKDNAARTLNGYPVDVVYNDLIEKDTKVVAYLNTGLKKTIAIENALRNFSSKMWLSHEEDTIKINIGLLGNSMTDCDTEIWSLAEDEDAGSISLMATDMDCLQPTELYITGTPTPTTPSALYDNKSNYLFYRILVPTKRAAELRQANQNNIVTMQFNMDSNAIDNTDYQNMLQNANDSLKAYAALNGVPDNVISLVGEKDDDLNFDPCVVYGSQVLASMLAQSTVATATIPLSYIWDKAVYKENQDALEAGDVTFSFKRDSYDSIETYFNSGYPLGVTLDIDWEDYEYKKAWCGEIDFSYSATGKLVTLHLNQPYTHTIVWKD